jgi:hypothetical protein
MSRISTFCTEFSYYIYLRFKCCSQLTILVNPQAKQNKQCTFNAAVLRVRGTILPLKGNNALLCIVFDLHLNVNNLKAFGVATDTQKCVPFLVFPSYKIFHAVGERTAVFK